MVQIFKQPLYENDSYAFRFTSEDTVVAIPDYSYLDAKQEAFRSLDISKDRFNEFVARRPSFANFDKVKDLRGSIYTRKAIDKNGSLSMDHLIYDIKANKDKGRRAYVDLSNSLREYIAGNIDTSCMTSIHFIGNRVTLYFRASDMTNELPYDLVLVLDHFIRPVFGNNKFTVDVFASSAQNIRQIKNIFRDA